MKTLLLFLFSIVLLVNLHGQNGCSLNFEGTSSWPPLICDIQIDNGTNPNNSWQIGEPQKNTFTSAISTPNAIVTDLIDPYPVNDTSSFIIVHIAEDGLVPDPMIGHWFEISFAYWVDTDSTNDYGYIEFSPDNGTSWYNITDNSTNFFFWNSNSDFLRGNSNGWTYAHGNYDNGLGNGPFNINLGDTVLFKFTFVSDSIFDNKDGLMFDNFQIFDAAEGIDEYQLMDSKVYPNPASSSMHIEFENAAHASYELSVYDQLGRKIHSASTSQGDITVDLQGFNSGFYQYSLFCPANQKRSTGKFIVH
jgi:hypothetical protein